MLGGLVHRFIVGEVIIALPSARGKVIRDIVQASAEAGVRNRTVPGLFESLVRAKAVSVTIVQWRSMTCCAASLSRATLKTSVSWCAAGRYSSRVPAGLLEASCVGSWRASRRNVS